MKWHETVVVLLRVCCFLLGNKGREVEKKVGKMKLYNAKNKSLTSIILVNIIDYDFRYFFLVLYKIYNHLFVMQFFF